jgi:hypothetical protein
VEGVRMDKGVYEGPSCYWYPDRPTMSVRRRQHMTLVVMTAVDVDDGDGGDDDGGR